MRRRSGGRFFDSLREYSPASSSLTIILSEKFAGFVYRKALEPKTEFFCHQNVYSVVSGKENAYFRSRRRPVLLPIHTLYVEVMKSILGTESL